MNLFNVSQGGYQYLRLRHATDPIFDIRWAVFGVRGLFQGPGPLPMALARRAIGISLIESSCVNILRYLH